MKRFLLFLSILASIARQQQFLRDTAGRLRDSLQRKELHSAKVEARWENYQGMSLPYATLTTKHLRFHLCRSNQQAGGDFHGPGGKTTIIFEEYLFMDAGRVEILFGGDKKNHLSVGLFLAKELSLMNIYQ